ncbi:MAG: 50S ribosomal protein L19e [Candidatus Nanoarchaeia archaeon]
MKLKSQKSLASRTLGISQKRIKFAITTAEDKKEFSEIISRESVRDLIQEGKIKVSPVRGISKTRAKYIAEQKKKGRRKGHGSRKGTANARMSDKTKWIIKLRAMRKLLKDLKDNQKIDGKVYRDLYRKAKGNFFRNKKHISLYIRQQNLALKKNDSRGGEQ